MDDEEDGRDRACGWGQGQGQPRSDASSGDAGAREEEGGGEGAGIDGDDNEGGVGDDCAIERGSTKEVEVVDVGDAWQRGGLL